MTLTSLLLLLALPQGQAATSEQSLKLFVDRPGITELSGRLIARPLAQELAAAEALVQSSLLRFEPAVREFILQVPEGKDDRGYAAELLATGLFEYVTPDWIVYPLNTPNDVLYGSQWHHATIQSAAAWDWLTDASSVISAFTDTGVDLNHPDLAARLISGYNAVEDKPQSQGGTIQDINGHGTMVAGTIGAIGNNSIGVAGVCWNVQLMPIRVSNDAGGGAYLSDLEQGARWAVDNGAKTISASYTGVENPSIGTTGTYVRSQGGLYFYAADNYNQNHSSFDWPDVVVVGATDSTDNKAWFSSYGLAVDCSAPGQDILTTLLGGGYGFVSGTSFSTPMTNAVAAMIWAANPYLNSLTVEARLYDGCDDLGAPGDDNIYGRGRVNLQKAVIEAVTGSMVLSISNLVSGSTANITVTGAKSNGVVYLAYSTAGTGILDVPSAGTTVAILAPQLLAVTHANVAGIVNLNRFVPGSAAGLSIHVMALEPGNGSNFVAAVIP
jgi:subtilisin family serine protease